MSLGVYSTLADALDGGHLDGTLSSVELFTAPRWGKPLFFAGHRFEGPDGQAYELVVDVWLGDAIEASHFKADGGAPDPVAGEPIPGWFSNTLNEYIS